MIIQHAIGAIQKTAEYLGLGFILDYVSGVAASAAADQFETGHVLTLGERDLTLNLRSRTQLVSLGKRNLTLTAPKE